MPDQHKCPEHSGIFEKVGNNTRRLDDHDQAITRIQQRPSRFDSVVQSLLIGLLAVAVTLLAVFLKSYITREKDISQLSAPRASALCQLFTPDDSKGVSQWEWYRQNCGN